MGKVNNALRMLSILRSREKVTRKELEVRSPEITRYKDDLSYAGVTITEVKGKYGGYVLDNNDYLLNLNLSSSEQLALYNTLDQLKVRDGYFYEDLKNAVCKIKAANKKSTNYSKSNVYLK